MNGLKASHYVELLMQTLRYLHIGAHRTLAMKTIYALQSRDSSTKTYYAGLITSSGVMQQKITLVLKWSNKTV